MTRCSDCGIRHERPQYKRLPESEETWGDFWRALGTMLLLVAALYAFSLVAAGYMQVVPS